jgi:hypothetical protein
MVVVRRIIISRRGVCGGGGGLLLFLRLLVEIYELPSHRRPHSADPQFWRTWVREKPVEFSWAGVEEKWVTQDY